MVDTPGTPSTDVPQWRVPQTFETATSFKVRDELQKYIADDLLGPWGGPAETLHRDSSGPGERYIVGRIGPRHDNSAGGDPHDVEPQSMDSELGGDSEPSDPELQDRLTPQAGKLWPSSMGLSCTVAGDTHALSVAASWGLYRRTQEVGDDGIPHSVWSREPAHVEQEVPLDNQASHAFTLWGTEDNGVILRVLVRPAPGGVPGRHFVEIFLVNNQPEPAQIKDTAWLFQPQLTVTAADGASPVFLPVDDPLEDTVACDRDPEEKHLRLLYRNVLKYADGRYVAVHAEVQTGERAARKLQTTWLPSFDVKSTKAPSLADLPQLAGLELSMDTLATLPIAALEAGLSPLSDGYRVWLTEQETTAAELPAALRPTADLAIAKAHAIADRLSAGIALLTDPARPGHAQALAAFRFANEAMALQRRHTAVAARREARKLTFEQALADIGAEGPAAASWRPFQLAFVVLNLPALTEPTHPERVVDALASPDSKALVDLLFFPTGGGKTEAYLGLTAFTFAIRRLQGLVGTGGDQRSGDGGVGVLMRYTLRLLTAQQFQRAAALVCAAEVLRRKDESTWGTVPFRIGLWVGAGVSPNWYEEAVEEIALAKDAGRGNRAKVLQILTCPWCGEKLRAQEDLEYEDETRRILTYCPRGEISAATGLAAACPFSKLVSPHEGLPVLTVDEEIYRLLPALVIATVDKLAQLPWKGYAGMLFGRVHRHCARHGYRHPDLDSKTKCTDSHNPTKTHGPSPSATARPELGPVKTTPQPRLRPPDLIIQDELHLISGALGTTVGLFEGAVDQLCTWRVPDPATGGFHLVGPKIVASTATTKRAADQVKRLFARDLAVFPPPVLDVADTFFSRQVEVTEDDPGRRYLGVCAHGIRLKAAEIRLADILLIAGQTLFDKYGAPADPYQTVVGYFNATRELAGMRRLLDDDVTGRVRKTGGRRGLSNRLLSKTRQLEISELTSRINSADITDALGHLEVEFDQDTDTSARQRGIAAAMAAAAREKAPISALGLPTKVRPVDYVLATSMLQVGVDVSRFGLMVVTGQPKNTAEYIQASSRVGRDANRPGLVVALYNWSRPRDLAHYEDFEHYHGTFYRQVEALSVTPYARRALDRGTMATYIAAIRNLTERDSTNPAAYSVDLDGDCAAQVRERFLDRAQAADGPRGRSYFAACIDKVRDKWKTAKTAGESRLGYEERKGAAPLRGLLERPAGEWTELTVGNSMRETENEINLLVPGGVQELRGTTHGVPAWSFAATSGDTAADDDAPTADEFGQTYTATGN